VVFSISDKSPNDPPHTTLYSTHDCRVLHGDKVCCPPNPNTLVCERLLGPCTNMDTNKVAKLFIEKVLAEPLHTRDKMLAFIVKMDPTTDPLTLANQSISELFFHLRTIVATSNVFICCIDGSHRSMASEFAVQSMDGDLQDWTMYSNLFTSLGYDMVPYRNDAAFLLECHQKSDKHMSDRDKYVHLTLWLEFISIPFQRRAKSTHATTAEFKDYLCFQAKALETFFIKSNVWERYSLMTTDKYEALITIMTRRLGKFELSFGTTLKDRQPKIGSFKEKTPTSFKFELNTMWIVFSLENILFSKDSAITLQSLVKDRKTFLVADTNDIFRELTIILGYIDIIISKIGKEFLVYDYTTDSEDKKASSFHALLYIWHQFIEFSINCDAEFLQSVVKQRSKSTVIFNTGSNFDSIVKEKGGLFTYMMALVAQWVVGNTTAFNKAPTTIKRSPLTQLLSFCFPNKNIFLLAYKKMSDEYGLSQALILDNGITQETEAEFVDTNDDKSDGSQRIVELQDFPSHLNLSAEMSETSSDRLEDTPHSQKSLQNASDTEQVDEVEDQLEVMNKTTVEEKEAEGLVDSEDEMEENKGPGKVVQVEDLHNEDDDDLDLDSVGKEDDRFVDDNLVDTPEESSDKRASRRSSRILTTSTPTAVIHAAAAATQASNRGRTHSASQSQRSKRAKTTESSQNSGEKSKNDVTYHYRHPTTNAGKDRDVTFENILCSIHQGPMDIRLVAEDPEKIAKVPIACTLIQQPAAVFTYGDGITLGRTKHLVDVIRGTHSFYISPPQNITITVENNNVEIGTIRDEWTRVVQNPICTTIATGYGHVRDSNQEICQGSSRRMLKQNQVVTSHTHFDFLPQSFLTVKDKMETVLNKAIATAEGPSVTYEVQEMALLFDPGEKGHVQNPHQDFDQGAIKAALQDKPESEKFYPVISFFAVDDFSIIIYTRTEGEFGAHVGRRIYVKKGCFLFLNSLLWHSGDFFIIDCPNNARIHGYAIPCNIKRSTESLDGLFPSNAVCRLQRKDIVDYPVQLIHTTPEGQGMLDYLKEIMKRKQDLSNDKIIRTRYKYGHCLRTLVALQDILSDKDFLLKRDDEMDVDSMNGMLTEKDLEEIDVVYQQKVMEMMFILREQRGNDITIFAYNGKDHTEMAKDDLEVDMDME